MPYSRFGVTKEELGHYTIDGIDGFHLHVMYDQSIETFARVIDNLLNNFKVKLPHLL